MNERTLEILEQISAVMVNLNSRIERLEGMQGPEQGLVGKSRSGCPKGHAEEAKPGERGVGKIVERDELLRHINSMMKKARGVCRENRAKGRYEDGNFAAGRVSALAELRKHILKTSGKRSDLPNEKCAATGSERNDHEGEN